MNTIYMLALEFFLTGLFSFGGGPATIPFLIRISQNHGWYSLHQLYDIIAIAEATPGPIGINMATYCGLITSGAKGAIVSTFSIILPSILIITFLSAFIKKYSNRLGFKTVFGLIKPVSCILFAFGYFQIIKATFFVKNSFKNIRVDALIVFIIMLVVSIFIDRYLKSINKKTVLPVIWILIGAVLGYLFKL